jgi:hypothetical protein
MNKYQNIQKNKFKENSKININKPTGSTIYSKNKKSLEKMLREYQTFCKKYFGESTPIGSMTEERMNKLLEDENNLKENNLFEVDKQHFLDTLDDNKNINFSSDEICDSLPLDIFYNDNSALGNHKNNKNDYKQRNKILFNQTTKKEEKTEKEEYNDFEEKENEITEEIKNRNAKEIQRIYREKKYEKKERIYFGFDKEKLNILKVYIDDKDNDGNIKKLDINIYSISENRNRCIKADMNSLIKIDKISKDELLKNLDEIIDKINTMFISKDVSDKNTKEIAEVDSKKNEKDDEEEKVLDEDGEEYTF